MNFLLCSTYHDPDFSLKELLSQALPIIKELFCKRIVCLTQITSKSVFEYLTKEGFIVVIESDNRQVSTYKNALRTTLNDLDDPNTQKIFHIDFDRLIHWVVNYPEELKEMVKKDWQEDYLHIGRTPRAFNSHPDTQKQTEIIVNEIGSKILGFNETKDIISVCYVITKALGQKILNIKNTTTLGFYGSWPIYFWNWATSKNYIEVEGHEWETPDRFRGQIEKLGYETWKQQFQTVKEWNKRVELLHECLLELMICSKFEFKP